MTQELVPPGKYTLKLVQTTRGMVEMEIAEGPQKGKRIFAPAHMVPQFTGTIEHISSCPIKVKALST
ncbi:hypothetical protein LCGC14_3006730 [marine sediment metagenome]|uniref:Uncharacterized protein n=1 Tax=marine sediment metagenome TaxID=412755 RepID=A0A0F8Z722_9ZZZZ